MNILIMNQSVTDLCASFFTLLTATVQVDGTHMSPDNAYDQFVCRIWLTRQPLLSCLCTSTYGILLMALDRYVAVVYPVWQNNNVRTASKPLQLMPVSPPAWVASPVASVCLSVCLFVLTVKGKRLELSTPNLVQVYSIAVAQHALTQRPKGQRSRSRSHGYENRAGRGRSAGCSRRVAPLCCHE